MNYVNKGPSYGKPYNAYDVAVVDAVTQEVIAYYIGYYNPKTKKFKLYPSVLTDAGRKNGYVMEVKTISESQLLGFVS